MIIINKEDKWEACATWYRMQLEEYNITRDISAENA